MDKEPGSGRVWLVFVSMYLVLFGMMLVSCSVKKKEALAPRLHYYVDPKTCVEGKIDCGYDPLLRHCKMRPGCFEALKEDAPPAQ